MISIICSSGSQRLFSDLFFLAALGLRCCARALSSCGERGPLLAAVRRLLIAVASPAAEHGLQARRLQQLQHSGLVVVACGLQSTSSAAVAHGPSRSTACGILLDQGLNPHPLHWQVDSQPLRHQGSPCSVILKELFSLRSQASFPLRCDSALPAGQTHH